MTAQITVGLPFFNSAKTVLASVQSVFAQTIDDWELILVDDGSTDGSVELLSRIEDPRVRLVVDGENRGLASRLNQISQLASAPLLARMDADDIMAPHRLETEVSLLRASGADLVFSDAVSIDVRSVPRGVRVSERSPSRSRYFRNSPYIHPTLLGRKDWYLQNPYDDKLRRCQDQELWVRTRDSAHVEICSEPLLYLREAGTVSARKYAASMAGTRAVLNKHGWSQLGAAGTTVRLVESIFKQWSFSVASRMRIADRLVGLRSLALTADDAARHAEVIRKISMTTLPGIDT